MRSSQSTDELTKDSRARSTIRDDCSRQDNSADQLLEKETTTDGLVNHPFAASLVTCRGDTQRARYSSGYEIVGRL